MKIGALVTVIGGVIIIAAVAYAVYIRLKKDPNVVDKDLAEKFLDGLKDTFYEKMTAIIKDFDYSKYDSIEEMEVAIIRDIYDTLYGYTQVKMQEASENDILSAMALKILDRKYIESFLDGVMNDTGIAGKIEEKCGIVFEKKAQEIEAEDKKLQEEFSDQTQYVEEADDKDLAPATEDVVTPEEEAELNPPKEEVTYDETSEGVEDMPDEIVSTVTASGKVYWYKVDENGKKTRIADPTK